MIAGPSWAPSARELDDLEMLLLGAYAPLDGFLGQEDVATVTASGRLVDGTAWPVPVTLTVPDRAATEAADAGLLTLLDEEGTPVGEVAVARTWPVGDGGRGVAGKVRELRRSERGSHRMLRRPPVAQVAAPQVSRTADPVLGVPVDRPLYEPEIAALRACARQLGATVLLLPLTGADRQVGLDGAALVRSCLAVAGSLGADVVPVPVPRHGLTAAAADGPDRVLAALVARAYGATHVPGPVCGLSGPPWVVELPDVVQDSRTGSWAVPAEVPPSWRGCVQAGEVGQRVHDLLARNEPVPAGLVDPGVLRELRRGRRAGGGTGFTVLFTGLSGSGKSTVARGLHDALLERTDRTVTLLDGDIVRRMLASELTFSREHRDLNVRRIGFVAAEVTRHGGIALCAPIAPYAASREDVRRMVAREGGFLLVHMSTPLEVCEARDRKGLYARARAGIVKEFTGISDPYEVPADADIAIDTSQTCLDAAVASILSMATARGWLR